MPTANDGSSQELRSADDLESYFDQGCKEPEFWKIGVEYETPVVRYEDAEAPSYEGASGIGRILEQLREDSGWEGIYEGDNLIALSDTKASITLEPGGQVEMSGEQCDSLHCADEELQLHTERILRAGSELGLAFLGLGITPQTPVQNAPWMPKQRYRIMREIMTATGSLGHRMMQQTATVQVNLDYQSESDAREKFRVAMAISPLIVAMSANSPIVDGHDSGMKSYRAHIWTDTDSDRCGILPFAFDTENIFHGYTQYALDVPMYFVVRDGEMHRTGGMTFRQFLSDGFEDARATMDDWAGHLATLFPEARLKSYIEVRAADMQPQHRILAIPAAMKGLLYTKDCTDAAWDVLKRWSLDQRREGLAEAARKGLSGRVGRHSMAEYAREILEIADEGLRRQAKSDADGRDERVFLEALVADVRQGKTPADEILEQWNGAWNGQIDRLVRHAAFHS
jgi:glutamate--cysteine ligase